MMIRSPLTHWRGSKNPSYRFDPGSKRDSKDARCRGDAQSKPPMSRPTPMMHCWPQMDSACFLSICKRYDYHQSQSRSTSFPRDSPGYTHILHQMLYFCSPEGDPSAMVHQSDNPSLTEISSDHDSVVDFQVTATLNTKTKVDASSPAASAKMPNYSYVIKTTN